MKLVGFDEAALDELFEAAEWYNSKQRGLARRLGLRRALLDRFPYALVFVELEREIRIVAVAHTSRRPGYWLERIE